MQDIEPTVIDAEPVVVKRPARRRPARRPVAVAAAAPAQQRRFRTLQIIDSYDPGVDLTSADMPGWEIDRLLGLGALIELPS